MYCLVLLVALGADAGHTDQQPRRYSEINSDLHTWLRREATAKTKPQRAEAIQRLADLYRELKHDPRLATSDKLTEYKNRLWSRLTRVKRDLKREFTRAGVVAETKQLAKPSALTESTTAGLADSLTLVGYASGGPSNLLTQLRSARGGRAIPDFGPGLVDLIERTIAPDFWDVNGGPGTIVYYAPLRVLVVRATSEVHGNVRGVLGGLRAAGK